MYESVPLTGAVFAALVVESSRGKVVSRADLVREIPLTHEQRGGLPARGDVTSVAKKALADLAKRGAASPVSQGFWRINGDLTADGPEETVEFGDGAESVYVYYFPAYRDQAAHLGRERWPMKIGMTAGEVQPRLRDQCGTAMPERPTVGMIYRTDAAKTAERLLHSSLETRGRRMADAPGKEWFLTSLTEVKEILDFTTSG